MERKSTEFQEISPVNNEEIMGECLAANKRSYKRAYDIAKETKTALIFERDGKLIEIYPHLEEEKEKAAPLETAT